MTWAAGMHDGGRSAVLIADTRATWRRSGETFDELRRVHLVGDRIAVAHSGPVQTGLALAFDLQRYAREASGRHGGDPEAIVTTWRSRAHAVAARIGQADRLARARLLVVATAGAERSGWLLESPRFEAKAIPSAAWSVISASYVDSALARNLESNLAGVSDVAEADAKLLANASAALRAVGSTTDTTEARLQRAYLTGEAVELTYLTDSGDEKDDPGHLVSSWKAFKSRFGTRQAALAEC